MRTRNVEIPFAYKVGPSLGERAFRGTVTGDVPVVDAWDESYEVVDWHGRTFRFARLGDRLFRSADHEERPEPFRIPTARGGTLHREIGPQGVQLRRRGGRKVTVVQPWDRSCERTGDAPPPYDLRGPGPRRLEAQDVLARSVVHDDRVWFPSWGCAEAVAVASVDGEPCAIPVALVACTGNGDRWGSAPVRPLRPNETLREAADEVGLELRMGRHRVPDAVGGDVPAHVMGLATTFEAPWNNAWFRAHRDVPGFPDGDPVGRAILSADPAALARALGVGGPHGVDEADRPTLDAVAGRWPGIRPSGVDPTP